MHMNGPSVFTDNILHHSSQFIIQYPGQIIGMKVPDDIWLPNTWL